ncbi:MAG: PTS fructose transporter subunit IIA [Burkholderiales bacterium]|nr:PTS fructose transporter subunit IIA [Burkholderiales bacterium]
MATIVLVAHAPLASALKSLALHTYAECATQVDTVDVPAGASLEEARALVQQVLSAGGEGEVLLLADVFGATPCNAALAEADGRRVRVVAGVNVPMLWRTLCYGHLPLSDLVARAADGGRQGVMQVASPRRQNQALRPAADDADPNQDQ